MTGDLILKVPGKLLAPDIVYFSREKKRLGVSCESSAKKMIYMKCQPYFSETKKYKKVN